MSTDSASVQQQKAREFMSLLPLTLEIAGLPRSQPGQYYNEGQMENRANVIRLAYKMARQIVQDVVK